MPEQIKRLMVIVIIIVAVFITARKVFVPETFYKYGHYRAAAIGSIVAQPIVYAGHAVCFDCHNDIEERKKNSYHRMVNCETCHGPGVDHISSFEEDEIILPLVERKRESCPICHEYDPAKPTGFPQINKVTHNPLKPCISCHDPHVPDPPEVPGECRACHARIANTKDLSPHSLLECIQCHKTPEEHKSNPRGYLPGKPENRSLVVLVTGNRQKVIYPSRESICILMVKVFKVKALQPTYRLSLLTALAFLIVAPLPLLAHLGHPERSFQIFLTPQLKSAMAMFGFVYVWYLMMVLLLEIWFEYRLTLIKLSESSRGLKRLGYRMLTLCLNP